MAEERGEFEIVVSMKVKSEIWQHCEFVKVKDEMSKTKIACRHCQIELKYSGNISNFSDNLTRKHSAVSLKLSKTKIACRHCQIELKYSGNISNFSDNLTRKHSAVSLLFVVPSIFSFSHNQCSRRQSKSSTLILLIT